VVDPLGTFSFQVIIFPVVSCEILQKSKGLMVFQNVIITLIQARPYFKQNHFPRLLNSPNMLISFIIHRHHIVDCYQSVPSILIENELVQTGIGEVLSDEKEFGMTVGQVVEFVKALGKMLCVILEGNSFCLVDTVKEIGSVILLP
jgi:hypothetical protein